MPVSPEVIQSVADVNEKNLGDAPAVAVASLYQGYAQAAVIAAQNLVTQQQQFNAISNALTAKVAEMLATNDPLEALGAVKALSGNDVAAQMQALLAALNSGQQGVKSAGNTPPVTP